MACKSNKIDSNITGLRIAEEECPRQLPTNPTWYGMEPNSYNDFGGQLTTISREPISPSRQKQKGTVTDLEASGGFNQDLTMTNALWLLQGFMFTTAREKPTTRPMNAAPIAITGIAAATKEFKGTALPVFKKGAIVKASGFRNLANNDLFDVSADSTATSLVVTGAVVDETPSGNYTVRQVGHKFGDGKVSAAMNGKLFRLVGATGVDMTTLNLIPGEWIYIGGENVNSRFDFYGFARVSAITSGYIEFNKTAFTPKVQAGTGKAICVYFGTVLKNEDNPDLIKKRSYQLERYLGNDANGKMSEYLVGAFPNEFTLTVNQADKITYDMSFVAMDNEQRDGRQGLKTGTRPAIEAEEAINTSSDFSRIKMSTVGEDANPNPLFAFVTELTLTINNNVSAAKAIANLGAIDTNVGMFDVGGKTTAYFASMEAVKAVRNNADVTIDAIVVKSGQGLLWDIPLLTLGDGRVSVEKDSAVTIPLDTNAVKGKFGHTLLFMHFPHLPNIA